ncbi:hypothetical protein IEN85_22300 [Pelagicoccus sp. NFK12]|uniref:Uncharacterized protein n=1 Tax=Pelagicoccus enzymogenes TaxID=2773457 RepID=A0A927IHG0_9BACT|nr:hypothetical protein [Pelagicoccus enzymogenes]MBD5782247.1 hypothetical protein [Pelagicoccus enzymogenes]
MSKHLKPLIKAIRKAPTSSPPAPWRETATIAVGGLSSVGFAEKEEHLLVVSSQGRSVIDCSTGERLERNREEYDEDTSLLEAEGIGPLAGTKIKISGLYGGGLPNSTDDMWAVHEVTLEWPETTLIMTEPGSWLYGMIYEKKGDFVKIGSELELRAFGFSPSGRSLVIATSSDVTIYHRK